MDNDEEVLNRKTLKQTKKKNKNRMILNKDMIIAEGNCNLTTKQIGLLPMYGSSSLKW